MNVLIAWVLLGSFDGHASPVAVYLDHDQCVIEAAQFNERNPYFHWCERRVIQ